MKTTYNQWNKKGQVTLFIIIAIVLLVAIGITYYVINKNSEITNEEFTQIQEVEINLRPIQQFVEKCMHEEAIKGIKKIGEGGGYIDPLNDESDYSFTIDESNTGNSEGTFLSSNKFIPYWYYSGGNVESDTIYPIVKFPLIDDIIKQHETYVDINLLTCLSNFSAIEIAGADITILEKPITEIRYTENDIIVKTIMPVSVNDANNNNKKITEYITRVKIPFLKYYSAATAITMQEYDLQYIEKFATSLPGFYGTLDPSMLPPLATTTGGDNIVTWTQSGVKQNIKQAIQSYVQLFKIVGTKNAYKLAIPGENPLEQGFYDAFTLPLLNGGHEELEINHIYINQPIYTHVQPSDGEIIGPKEIEGDFGDIVGTVKDLKYRFYYDMTFPVIVEIREENLPGNEDFSFMFALEANVRNNLNWKDYAMGNGPIPWDYDWVNVDIAHTETEVFDFATNETYDNEKPTINKKLFANKEQFISGNITARVYDAYTLEPITDSSVVVGISSYASAKIGKTQLHNNEIIFKGPSPLVTNGVISFKKNGYVGQSFPITTQYNIEQDVGTIKLWPKSIKNITLKVYEISSGITRELNSNENVMLIFEKINTDSTMLSSHGQVTNINKNSTTVNVELIPGRYKIIGQLIDENGIVIPAKCKHICNWKTCWKIDDDKEWIPIEPIEMKPAIWGGLEFNEENPVTFTKNKLYDNNTIELTVMKFPPPTCIDSMEAMSKIPEYTKKYRSTLLPKFIEI